jgi:hypothetical protein
MKPGSKDKKIQILISGNELSELKRHSEANRDVRSIYIFTSDE